MKPQRFFMILMAVLVVLVIGGGAGCAWAGQHLRSRADELRHSLAATAVASEQVDQLASLQKQFQALQPKFAKLDAALPKTKNQSQLILQLQQLAGESGMSIPSASFTGSTATVSALPSQTSQTIKVGALSALPLSFQLSGTYDQMQSFLTKLEQLDRFTNVTALTITKSETKNTLTFNVTLYAYVKP